MSNEIQLENQSGEDSILQSQVGTDALLERVNEQIGRQTFDYNDRQLLKSMVESLGDSRGMVRLGFVEAFGKIGNPATPFLLESLASHPNPVVRRSSAKALAIIADPKAIPTLIDALLKDEDTVVKGSSAGALARIGEAVVPALLEILASPKNPGTTKGHATWALAFIGAKAKEQFYQAIDSDSPEVRAAVVGAIANITEENPEDRAFALLVNALKDLDLNVRVEAAAALGKLKYRAALPNLIELLALPDSESRKAAAIALMKIGDRAAIEPLQAASNQEAEQTVKGAIDLAISQIQNIILRECGDE